MGLGLILSALLSVASNSSSSNCETYQITGYVRGAGSDYTADGTSVWNYEAIAAGSYNLPFDTVVDVDGIGQYRIADRGPGLSSRHIDILVDSVSEARALTSRRVVCIIS